MESVNPAMIHGTESLAHQLHCSTPSLPLAAGNGRLGQHCQPAVHEEFRVGALAAVPAPGLCDHQGGGGAGVQKGTGGGGQSLAKESKKNRAIPLSESGKQKKWFVGPYA